MFCDIFLTKLACNSIPWSVLPLKRAAREAAARRRPARSGRKNAFFPRNDRPYGLQGEMFQTENALEEQCVSASLNHEEHACDDQDAARKLPGAENLVEKEPGAEQDAYILEYQN